MELQKVVRFTPVVNVKPRPHLYANVKHITWMCRRTAFTFIRLCGICSANWRTLSVWSWYYKGKYVRNHTDVDLHLFGQPTNNQQNTCLFACVANAEQATFWHSFAFPSVPHALFVFVYRCGRTLYRKELIMKQQAAMDFCMRRGNLLIGTNDIIQQAYGTKR